MKANEAQVRRGARSSLHARSRLVVTRIAFVFARQMATGVDADHHIADRPIGLAESVGHSGGDDHHVAGGDSPTLATQDDRAAVAGPAN
jgi:hypothetical protein